jgi:ferredoxin/flavodoxin---NADP+ reductase
MAGSPDKYYSARIVDRRDVSADLCILRVDPGGPLEYRAGQYATLGIERESVRTERAYSMVSSPYEEALEFFVELVPNGGLTPDLFRLHPGDTLLCRKIAKGRFTLDLRSGRTNHLLISTVTGVAPFVSYVRTLYRDWKSGGSPMPGEHKLFCLQGASHSFEFGYREELQRYASEAPWFQYVPTVSRPWDNTQWTGEIGRVDDLLRKYAEAWKLRPDETTAYLCGHPTMIENSRGILHRAGWKKDAVLEEAYFPLAAKEVNTSG